MLIMYCSNCNVDLDSQLGFSRFCTHWSCANCGELLINPDIDMHDKLFPDVLWFCDECGELLNIQLGFEDDKYLWVCECCGYINEITKRSIKYERIIEYVKICQLADAVGKSQEDVDRIEAQVASYEQIKELISVDTLKTMQLLGFNYKAAIGDPLTSICANAINSWGNRKQNTKKR